VSEIHSFNVFLVLKHCVSQINVWVCIMICPPS